MSSSGLTSATTAGINVLPGAATKLVVQNEPPSSLASGATFGMVIDAVDAFGNVDPSFAGQIVVGLIHG